jgi:hypothetical protein
VRADLPPVAYVLALCGVPNAGGLVRRPLLDDDAAYASCQVYEEAA